VAPTSRTWGAILKACFTPTVRYSNDPHSRIENEDDDEDENHAPHEARGLVLIEFERKPPRIRSSATFPPSFHIPRTTADRQGVFGTHNPGLKSWAIL
jgi:hypothetical protein